MSSTLTNWSGHHTYQATCVITPNTLDELRHAVTQSQRLKVIGARHSFNHIADSPDTLISLAHFDRVIALDRANNTVTVGAGITYGQLCQYLHEAGYALHNVASLPHITVAGACATATHGSGDGNGGLATAVLAFELMTAAGELVTVSPDTLGAAFYGAVVGLGALGVVTQLTLRVQPSFEVQQVVYQNLPFAQLEAHFDAVMSHAYSVSLFTNWLENDISQVWVKHRLEVGDADRVFVPDWLGATLAGRKLHPIGQLPADSCTEQLGARGSWHERLHHFKIAFTPSSGEELQSEYFVARQHAVAAICALRALAAHIAPVLQISEVRSIAADDLWLSPCYQQDSIGLHFTWQKNWTAVKQVLPMIEASLAPFNAKPHWGKLFTLPAPRLRALYAHMPDFVALAQQFDPTGKLRNAFLDEMVFGA